MRLDVTTDRRVRASAVTLAVAAIPLVLTLWDYRLQPLRRTFPTGLFSQYFDDQAAAILDGHLWIRDGLLGIEAFRHNGHEYMYFGPLPALLRLPVVAVTDRFYARLGAPSILLAWVIAAVFAAALVWRIRAMVSPERALPRWELVVTSAFIGLVTGGSALLFLAANPWVYSEALMWSVATSLGAFYGLIGVLIEPTYRRIALTGVMTMAAVLSRVTSGWGCCLAILGASLVIYMVPSYRTHRHVLGALVAAGAAPLVVGIVVNYVKFGHPLLLPFADQAWTDISATRRQVLADGGFTGARFLPSTLVNYLRPDGFSVSPIFPYLAAPRAPAEQVGHAGLDMRYRTVSATASMPLLFVLGVVGLARIARPGASRGPAHLRVPLLGALTILTGLFGIGYIAQRYVAEFVPALTIAGTVGLVTILERVGRWPRRRRSMALALATAVTLFGATTTLAASLSMSRYASGGTALRGLVEVQAQLSDVTGHPLTSRIRTAVTVPDHSAPDDLVIIGDCDAVFAGTGDLYEPWKPVDVRAFRVTVRLGEPPAGGTLAVVAFRGYRERTVAIEFDDLGQYRVTLTDSEIGPVASDWNRVERGRTVTVDVSAATDHEAVYKVDVPGHLVDVPIAMADVRPDLVNETMIARPVLDNAAAERFDVLVDLVAAPTSDFCRGLARR